jgi:2-C-methyl-D-erythritol 4-phosphate cytidylyltransferase
MEAMPSSPHGERVACILVAAGASVRMGVDKLWADLRGRPLLEWPIATLAGCGSIDELVVVAALSGLERTRRLLEDLGVKACVVVGGARRQDSVRAGLSAIGDADWVVVHDAARPLVTRDLVENGLETARATGAAVAAVPVVDTIKVVNESEVVSTLARNGLWSVQTPQVFRADLLRQAHRAGAADVTDDATLVEGLGVRVQVYMGAYANIKVTSPVDLRLAALLVSEDGGQPTRAAAHTETPPRERRAEVV